MEETNNINNVLRESAVDITMERGMQINAPNQRADFIFPFGSESVEEFNREGDDLIILLDDGQIIVIVGFYPQAGEHALIFQTAEGQVAIPWLAIVGGAAGVAAAVGGGGGGAAVGGGGGGAAVGGGDGGPAIPTVNDADSTQIINGMTLPNSFGVSGTGEPGDTVSVTVSGETVDGVIDENSLWSVTFEGNEFPNDGVWKTSVVVDHAGGGSTTLDGPDFTIDTIAPDLAITSGVQATDDVFNLEELDGGVAISGTGEVGASVSATIDGKTKTITVGEDGIWTVTWPVGTFAAGEYTTPMTVVATDAMGNTTTVNEVVEIDTVAEVSIETNTVAGDGTINGTEHAEDDVTFTGITQPGSTVDVTFGTTTVAATVDINGNWTVDIPMSAIATGEYDATVTAEATDANGNTTTAAGSIQIDTFMNLSQVSPVEGDNVVNQAEVSNGINLSGTVEPGSTIMVAFKDALPIAATVDVSGIWSVLIPASAIAPGSYDADITVTATDAAGNKTSIADTLVIDTEAPGSPVVIADGRSMDGLNKVIIESSADDAFVVQIDEDGLIANIAGPDDGYPGSSGTEFNFDTALPTGSDLIIYAKDSAGNSSGTILVVDDRSIGSTTDMSSSGLGDFQIETVDLRFAEESHLTITEAQLVGLADFSNTLTVRGGVDDTVTIIGATKKTESETVDGQIYDIYSFGDATVRIEDDIWQVNTSVVG